jgi:outer membrane protein assembly factor BamB
MRVIDLGDLTEPPRAGLSPRRRPAHRWRGAGLALTSAICAAALNSPPAGESTVRVLWTAPHARTLLTQADQDTVYAHRAVDGGGELTAYDLDSGRVRWSRPTSTATVSAGWLSVLPAAGLLLVPAEDGDTAVDTRTGTPLWTLTGTVENHGPGTVLVRDRDDRSRSTRLRLVDAADGSTIWERPTGDARAVRVAFRDGRPATIAVDTGELTLLRYADGEPLATGDLPRLGVDEPALTFAGGHLLVQRHYRSGFTVTAHRLDTLAERWRVERTGGGGADDCGAVICLSSSAGIAGLDPGTGVEKWARPGDRGSWPVDGDRAVVAREPRTSGEGRRPLLSLIDTGSGRSLGPEIAGEPVFSTVGGRRLLVVRTPDSPVAPAVVQNLDLGTGRGSVIGAVDYELLNAPYELAGRHLIRIRDGRLQVMSAG